MVTSERKKRTRIDWQAISNDFLNGKAMRRYIFESEMENEAWSLEVSEAKE